MSDDQPAVTAGDLKPDRFPPHSRYATSEILTVGNDAEAISYLGRRFLPEPDGMALIAEHLVVDGDRLDLLAQRYYGDPLLSWRIADANRGDDPARLTSEPGRVLRIPSPDGTSGFGGPR
jgi:nucleoid-associated protein YgaU